MRKWLILAVLLVVLVVVVGVALTNFNRYLNENKDWVAEQAEAAIGRKVSFDEIGVSVVGGLGARIENLRIADDPRFADGDFVRAGSVRVAVRILPALTGRYEVKYFVLEKPEVVVIQTKDGFNFDSLGAAEGSGGAGDRSTPESEQSGANGSAAAVLIAAVHVEDGTLRYIDRTASAKAEPLTVEKLDFEASGVSLTDPIHIQMAAAVLGAKDRNVSLQGTVGPIGEAMDVNRAPLDLDLKLGPLVLDELKGQPLVGDSLPPDLQAPDPVSMQVDVAGTLEQPALIAAFDGSSAAISMGSSLRKPKGVPLKLEVAAQPAGSTIDVKGVELVLAGLKLSGKGKVTLQDVTSIAMGFTIARTDLKGWDKLLPALEGIAASGTVEGDFDVAGPVGGDALPKVTGKVSFDQVAISGEVLPAKIAGFTSVLELTGDGAKLPPTKFALGKSPVELGMTVANFGDPLVRFNFGSPKLALASVGAADPPGNDDEVIEGLSAQGTVQAAEEGRSLPRFRGSVSSSGGHLRGVDYQTLGVEASIAGDVATVSSLRLTAADGVLTAKGRYDMRDASRPKFDWQSTVEGMRLATLLANRFPAATQNLEGALYANLSLSGAGDAWETIRKTLTGDGRAELRDGSLKNVNVADSVLSSITGVPGLVALVPTKVRKDFPELFTAQDTRFDKLEGSVQIADGRVQVTDTRLNASDYRIEGRGFFSFESAVDFNANLIASERLTREVLEAAPAARTLAAADGRIRIPFRMAGTLPNVRPQPDLDFVAKAVGGALIQEGIGRLLGEAVGGGAQQKPAGQGRAAQGPKAATQDAEKQGKQGKQGKQRKKPKQDEPKSTEELIQKGLEQLF